MSTEVEFPVDLGGDGGKVTNDTDPVTGLFKGGFKTNFVYALQQFVAMLQFAKNLFTSMQSYGATFNDFLATSTTSLAIGTGTKAFTIGTGKGFVAGMRVRASLQSDPDNFFMVGPVASYTGGVLTLTVTATSGAGTFATWLLILEPVDVPAPLYGFVNRLLNGSFKLALHTDANFITPGSTRVYKANRWFCYAAGANLSASPTTGGILLTGSVGNTLAALGQRIESVNIADLASKAVMLMADMSVNTGSVTVTWTASRPSASADAWGADGSQTKTQIATGTINVTTTRTTFLIPITLPANANRGVEILFTAAIPGIDWTTYEVALIEGSKPTPYPRRSYQEELAHCRRYHRKAIRTVFSGDVTSASVYYGAAAFDVPMRAAPNLGFQTNVSNTSFSTSVGTAVEITAEGFRESRTANASAAGRFSTSWDAECEL